MTIEDPKMFIGAVLMTIEPRNPGTGLALPELGYRV